MKNLLLAMIGDMKFKVKKNLIAKHLRTNKYKQRVIKSKKGKGSFTRKKST